MCGIFASNIKIENEILMPLLDKHLKFRGPDAQSGIVKKNTWQLYHARLKIIDFDETSNQPYVDQSGGTLLFNGEIFNYRELGQKYFNKIYKSDTKLLSDLINENKLDLSELEGFFSIVHIASNGRLNLLARDKFGVKPLFYYKNKNNYCICSEPAVIQKLFSCSLNEQAIEEYKKFRAPIYQESFFNNIKSVKPGTCEIRGTYWSLEQNFKQKKIKPEIDKLEETIREAVSSRMISDAKIGLLVSKGIDSNLIRYYSKCKNLYTIGFKGDEDLEYFKSIQDNDVTAVEINDEEFKKHFRYLIELRGEPLSVPNEVLLYIVGLEAKKDGVKVLLSGEGADEFFGGYDRIYKWAMETKTFDVDTFLELYSYMPVETGSTIYEKTKKIFNECPISEPFDMVRWFFIKYHMPILFRRLDFALMAAGIEGREPLASSIMFDLCKKFSSNDLIAGNLGKKPLRVLAQKYFGKKFAWAPKVGFPVNVAKIFKEEQNAKYNVWFDKNLESLKWK